MMPRRKSILVGLIAASVAVSMPGLANACRLGPLPSEAQRATDIQQRQAEAWTRSSLVYLAAVTEVRSVPKDGHPFGEVQLALTALVVLKGDGRPGDFDVVYSGLDRRCGRDFLDLAGGAQVNDLFVIYASTAEPSSADDIWSQAWPEVRDPVVIRTASQQGWDQDQDQRAHEPTEE